MLLAPAAASAQVWRPLSPTDQLAPLDPISSGPVAFPAPTAPHIIVGVAPGADLDAVAASLRPYASSLQVLRAVGEVTLVASNAAEVADLAGHDPRIEFAEPDRSFSGLAEPFDAVDPVTGLAYDWQYDAVQAGPAIAAVGGGSSTIVAVVDSGVDVAQPDLAGRLLPGYDATLGDGTVFDSVGHGTFVAGLITMVDGNDIGSKGIAGATRVLPVRASARRVVHGCRDDSGHHVGGRPWGRRDQPEPRRPGRRPGARPGDRLRDREGRARRRLGRQLG